MHQIQPMKQREAVSRMRALSEQNIPFSFGFIKCNTTKGTSDGYKVVKKAILGAGLRADQSDKHNTMISYVDYSDKKEVNRMFHYPLLMMFNGQKVQP